MENANVPRRLTEMPRRDPTNGTFELTVRCNLHCKMCLFRHADCENAELMRNELTAAQWIDMARQAAEAGTFSLLITGGEPMLRPDFCEIWEGIYKQGFVLTLYTNATLVTPEIMETLKKYPPHKIGVTIYGASPETYEKVCGDAKGFQKAIDGIHRLKTLPSTMEFRTTLIQDNFADSKAIDDLVRNEFGAGVKQASPINKAVRGACADVESCRVPPELDCERKMQRRLDAIRDVIGPSFDPKRLIVKRENRVSSAENKHKDRLSLFGCDAGMSQYTITFEGKLIACQMIDAFSTNACRDGLQTAWKRFPYEVHIPPTDGKCDNCEFLDCCPSCYGSRYAETGDFNGCSDYIYREAKARKYYEDILGGYNNEQCEL